MASAIDLTLDDDDSVELMGPPVTDLTADSQDSLPPPRRAPPAAAAPAAAPVATESQQEAPAVSLTRVSSSDEKTSRIPF